MQLKALAALAALLTTTAAHAYTPEDRAAWTDLQGRWKGRFRLEENDCNWKGGAHRALIADFRVKADADLDDPENGGLMTGRAGKRRYDGFFAGVDPKPCDPDVDDDSCYEDEFANAVFYSDAPVRMGNGWTCRVFYRVAYYYTGGPTAEVNFTQNIRCRGTDICETTYRGTLKKARR